MTEQEVEMAQKAQMYDLRLMFTYGEKDTYTTGYELSMLPELDVKIIS